MSSGRARAPLEPLPQRSLEPGWSNRSPGIDNRARRVYVHCIPDAERRQRRDARGTADADGSSAQAWDSSAFCCACPGKTACRPGRRHAYEPHLPLDCWTATQSREPDEASPCFPPNTSLATAEASGSAFPNSLQSVGSRTCRPSSRAVNANVGRRGIPCEPGITRYLARTYQQPGPSLPSPRFPVFGTDRVVRPLAFRSRIWTMEAAGTMFGR